MAQLGPAGITHQMGVLHSPAEQPPILYEGTPLEPETPAFPVGSHLAECPQDHRHHHHAGQYKFARQKAKQQVGVTLGVQAKIGTAPPPAIARKATATASTIRLPRTAHHLQLAGVLPWFYRAFAPHFYHTFTLLPQGAGIPPTRAWNLLKAPAGAVCGQDGPFSQGLPCCRPEAGLCRSPDRKRRCLWLQRQSLTPDGRSFNL